MYRSIKRTLDVSLSVLLIVSLLPVMSLVALLVWYQLGTPILFRHRRAGIAGKPFVLLKFRTMTSKRDSSGHLLPNEERITPLGRFLRRSSVDELPSLWNVIRGEMSIVGPRPLLLDYVSIYSPEQRRRLLVRPGITGLAQVNGRNSIDWQEKLRLDVLYVDNQSLALDLRIMLMTSVRLLVPRGIDSSGRVGGARFLGPTAPDDRQAGCSTNRGNSGM